MRELRDSKACACSNSDVGEVLFYVVMNRELSNEIYHVSFGGISQDLVERLTYLCSILCLLMKKFHKAKFEIEAKDTNLQKAKKLPL